MSRPVVSVKSVTEDLERAFTELWMSSRVETGTSPEVVARAASEGKIAAALNREDVRAFVALSDGRTVGFAVASSSPFSPLVETPCVTVDQLYVAPEMRRHGVARVLLGAVALYAESRGCEQVGCHVPAQQRDANRFFARLGFGSQTVRRVTTVAALRRRLGADEPRHHSHSLEQLLYRRRSLRAKSRGAGGPAGAAGRLVG